MKKLMFIVSCVAVAAAMTSCKDPGAKQAREALNEPFKQEREMLREAIRHHSPDVQRVDLLGNTLVYTHIFDGIIDVKTYTYDGDVCVEAERIYTFPNQMSALRHYRRAVEQAQLYDDIQLFNNEVKYKLKAEQYALETKSLNKEQLKAKFEKQIDDAKADMKRHNEAMKADIKRYGKDVEMEMGCCDGKSKDCKDKACKK